MSVVDSATAFNRETISIGLISDTHFWPNGGMFESGDGSLQLLGSSEQLLASLIDDIDKVGVDLILHLGDVTCGGGTYTLSEDEFHEAQRAVHEGLTRGSTPTYALPGNHDCPPGGGLWTDFERRWSLGSGLGRTIDTPFARLILLNAEGHSSKQVEASRPGDPVYGWVNETEMKRLDDALASAGDLPVIVFLHQLLQPWSGDHPTADYYLVANAQAVQEVMARHGNVRMVFQGHAHRFDVQQRSLGDNLCWYVICPAMIQYPLGWLALTLAPQRIRIQFHSLPLPKLLELTRESGGGQTWRAGQSAWHDMTLDLE